VVAVLDAVVEGMGCPNRTGDFREVNKILLFSGELVG